MVYPLRLLSRILLILALLYLGTLLFEPQQPQVYISAPRIQTFLEEVESRTAKIKQAAQDLPGSIEVILRRIFYDGKPSAEAKSV